MRFNIKNMADLTSNKASSLVSIIGSDLNGSETIPINSTNKGELLSCDVLNNQGKQTNLVVGLTAIELKCDIVKLANRKMVTALHFEGTGKVYWGYDSNVTIATGTPLFKMGLNKWKINDQSSVFLISDTAAQNVRITEI